MEILFLPLCCTVMLYFGGFFGVSALLPTKWK